MRLQLKEKGGMEKAGCEEGIHALASLHGMRFLASLMKGRCFTIQSQHILVYFTNCKKAVSENTRGGEVNQGVLKCAL